MGVDAARPQACQSSGVEVRALTNDDWHGLWPFLEAMGTASAEAETKERFSSLLLDDRWLLLGSAADNDELLGYAAVQDYGPHLRLGNLHRTARLHDLFVLPRARQQGVGRALMQGVVGWATSRVRYLEWQAHETRAAPFYERLGYHGEPCPQPDYPTFELTFDRPT